MSEDLTWLKELIALDVPICKIAIPKHLYLNHLKFEPIRAANVAKKLVDLLTSELPSLQVIIL